MNASPAKGCTWDVPVSLFRGGHRGASCAASDEDSAAGATNAKVALTADKSARWPRLTHKVLAPRQLVTSMAVSCATLASSACAGTKQRPVAPAQPEFAFVINERGPNGPRIVAVAANGNRQFELVAPAKILVRDSNPALSPDGKWLIFASSRGREIGLTSLWAARVGVESTPMPLTTGPWVDTHPCWSPDGKSVVFASTKNGNFDLVKLELEFETDRLIVKKTVSLTTSPEHEVTPHIAADGRVVYAVVSGSGAQSNSSLRIRNPDGSETSIGGGNADGGPSFSPDGKRVAFTAPVVRTKDLGGKPIKMVDGDLFVLDLATNERTLLLGVAGTDEVGPVWSPDGELVFATSLLRGADNRVLFSSVVFGKSGATDNEVRILVDRVGAVERLSPIVAAAAFGSARVALSNAPAYLPVLKRTIAEAIEAQGFGAAGQDEGSK